MSSLAVLLANPSAGAYKEESIKKVRTIIERKGLKVELLLSRQRGDIEALSRKSLELLPEMVCVVGGDGTFNEAANGFVHSDVPVGFIPLGTTNVLARELSIPGRIERAVEKILSGGTHRISLGKMTHEDKESRYFILMAGAGFDGDVVYNVNPKVKKVLGKGAYVLKGMKLLGKYHPEPITVKTNGTESIGYTVIVGNAGCYAGGFRMTPNASLFSPYFYVFVIKRNSRFSIVRTFFKLLNASHIHAKDVSYFRTQSLRLEGSSHIQVDGDCSGQLPVEISIERECLNILH